MKSDEKSEAEETFLKLYEETENHEEAVTQSEINSYTVGQYSERTKEFFESFDAVDKKVEEQQSGDVDEAEAQFGREWIAEDRTDSKAFVEPELDVSY